MKTEELRLVMEQGEGLKTEFKENFDAKSIAKEITAFANSEGGRIFLGISDKEEIKGIEITNKLKSEIQDIARNCDLSIKIEFEEVNNILVINVFEGENKPYQCSSGFYMREGPNSQKLSRDEILKFITGVGKIKFDEQINENFKFPEDFDESKFNDFLKKCNISNVRKINCRLKSVDSCEQLSDFSEHPKNPTNKPHTLVCGKLKGFFDDNIEDILANLSLAVKKGNKIMLNNAGILLFGKNIERFVRNNKISCILFKGKERIDIIDRKEFSDDLFFNYENALKFLKQHLRLEYIIRGAGPREEKLEIPEEALREALINSLVHRDYFETGVNVSVDIFDNRVEISNWGKLLFDRKELGKISAARNPILFDIFHRIDLIEKAGSGIGRIRKLLAARKLKVKFQPDDFFRVTFERPLLNVPENVPENRRELILKFISNDNKITIPELASKLHVNEKTVKRDIDSLKQNNLLKRIGPDKGGYWEIIE